MTCRLFKGIDKGLELGTAVIDVIKHVEGGGSGRHEDDGTLFVTIDNARFGIFAGESDGFFEGLGKEVARVVGITLLQLVTRFADEDNLSNMVDAVQKIVKGGEVFVTSLITTAEDEDDSVIWEGADGDFGRTEVGGEIIVVIFDTV